MTTLLLAVDVGNTNVSLGIFDYAAGEAELAHHWRLSTNREQTSDEVAGTLRSLFSQSGCKSENFSDVILCSVVPPLQPIWERVCQKLFDRPPILIGLGTRTGMPVRYENPREVGADRIVNAVAAFELARRRPSIACPKPANTWAARSSRESTSPWRPSSSAPPCSIASRSRAPGR